MNGKTPDCAALDKNHLERCSNLVARQVLAEKKLWILFATITAGDPIWLHIMTSLVLRDSVFLPCHYFLHLGE